MPEKDALARGEKIIDAFREAGWAEGTRFRLRCTECDYSQETRNADSARHFDGAVDSTGHGYVAEARAVLLSPWHPIADFDAAEASADG